MTVIAELTTYIIRPDYKWLFYLFNYFKIDSTHNFLSFMYKGFDCLMICEAGWVLLMLPRHEAVGSPLPVNTKIMCTSWTLIPVKLIWKDMNLKYVI